MTNDIKMKLHCFKAIAGRQQLKIFKSVLLSALQMVIPGT